MGGFPRSAALVAAIAFVSTAYTTAACADDPVVSKTPAAATVPQWPTPAISPLGSVTATVARRGLPGKMADDDLVSPPPVSARDHPARRLALCAFHAQLSRRRRSARSAWARRVLRNGAAMGLEVRTVVRPRTSPPIAGRQFWLWRAVDDEGEVLDLLVQRRRDKAAAVKLMRKLLKKQGFAPDVLVTDKLRSYGAARSEMGLSACHEQGLRKNNRAENSHQPTRRRERKMHGSNRPDQPSASCPFTPPFTTRSMSNAISHPAARFAS